MATTIDRRHFLLRGALVSGAAIVGGTSLRATLARAATIAGPGPYGALSATADANGFHLPAGFSSRLLAVSGSVVPGTSYSWHANPDGGVCVPTGGGGWVYVSNSETGAGGGGAGVLQFDTNGTIVDAYRILSGTNRNCAGGLTAAGNWFSCEESGSTGKVYECNPLIAGQGTQRPALGSFNHEAAVEDSETGHVYLTEDDPNGRLYRFVPSLRGDFSSGQLFAANVTAGSITWVPTSASVPDRQASTSVFNGGEGLWIEGRTMYVTTKGDKRVWTVDLTNQTMSVLYDGVANPSAALNAVDNCTVHRPSGDVYVCEDGGNMEICLIADTGNGDKEVAAFLRIAGHSASEWCGVAFSPDATRMYISSQRGTDGVTGRTYEITGPFRTSITPSPPTETLVPAGAVWRYRDLGVDLGTTWREYFYDDSTWMAGPAPLGYGDPMATTVGFGPSSTAKHITTYFRRTFPATHGFDSLTLSLRRDDGAVVYLNGTEIARSNMPSGAITATTLAPLAIAGADETAYVSLPVTGQLYNGTNVIAVEVHQNAGTSSDLGFDLALTGRGNTGTLPAPPTLPPPPPPPPVAPTTLIITEDADVRDGSNAARNYGTATTAQIRSGTTGNNRWYYLRAQTSSHTGSVSRAVLRVRMQGARGVSTPVVVKAAPSTWTETGITWNNKPGPGTTVATATVVGNGATWYEIDVTAYVNQQRAAGTTMIGFVVQASQATSPLISVSSGEATTTNRPRLILTP